VAGIEITPEFCTPSVSTPAIDASAELQVEPEADLAAGRRTRLGAELLPEDVGVFAPVRADPPR
jgi:hypothetical protein